MWQIIGVGVAVPALVATVAGLYVGSHNNDRASHLVGATVDMDPAHWQRLDSYPDDVGYLAEAFDGDSVLIVPDFLVNQNGCGSGQTRVTWRSLGGRKVAPGITGFLDAGMDPEDFGSFEERAESGTMTMTNCEQPMWKLEGGNFQVVIEAGFYGPAVGG